MNPVFVFLVFLAGFLIWLLCSFLYRPIGRLIKRLFADADRAIKQKDEEKEKRDV